jgi:hypothetical protein
MKKPIATPHSPPTLQKSKSFLANFHAGAIIFLTCIGTASVLEMLARGGSELPQNIPGVLSGRLVHELAPIQYELSSKRKFHCMELTDITVPLEMAAHSSSATATPNVFAPFQVISSTHWTRQRNVKETLLGLATRSPNNLIVT